MGKRIQKLMLKDLAKKTLYLGYASENIHTQIVIDCSEVFWDYPNATYSMNIQPPRGDKYPAAQLAKDGDALVWTITDSDLIYHGSGHIQLEFKNDDEVIKSAVGTTKIDGSIETTGDVPTPLEDWMDQAEETAHQIALTAKDEVIEQIQDAAEEARESIPADYTELSDDVSSLKSAFEQFDANVITESAGPAPIVSIADGADGMPMRKVEVAIEPVQDLHGYDSPWPAGGGKNLLNWESETATIRGVAFTVNSDGTISIDGTASGGDASFYSVPTYPYDVPFKTGSYVLSGCPSGGSSSTYFLNEILNGKSDTGAGVPFTLAQDGNLRIRVVVRDGVTVNNVLFKPMIRLASVSDASFAPYSNICPISGWTGAKVTRTGKNIYDFAALAERSTSISEADGYYTFSGYTADREFPVANGGTNDIKHSPARLTLSFEGYCSNGTAERDGADIGFIYSDGTAKRITIRSYKSPTNAQKETKYSLTSDEGKIVVGLSFMYHNNDTAYIKNVQIETGSTASFYEEYQGQTYEVTFPADPGTVYGGTLDVVSGKLVVDRAMVAITSSTTKSATRVNSNGVYNANYVLSSVFGIGFGDRSKTILCNSLGIYTRSNIYGYGSALTVGLASDSGSIYVMSTASISTEEGFNAWLDLIGTVQVCFYLATTVTYQLTPTEIKTLLGINNIWSDAGNTSIIYPADTKMYIDRKIAEAVANALNA